MYRVVANAQARLTITPYQTFITMIINSTSRLGSGARRDPLEVHLSASRVLLHHSPGCYETALHMCACECVFVCVSVRPCVRLYECVSEWVCV